MASVDFKKIKGAGDAKSKLMHCDKAERAKHEHSNKDIDKTRTALNGSMLGRSYEAACRAYDDRIAALDAQPGANKRRDRVTLMGLDVPRPLGLDDVTRQNAWFRRVWEITSQTYGTENMIEGYIHRDEVHDYIDPDTRQRVTSREHMQMYVVPVRDGRLCAKECTAKASMIALNEAIQKMTEQEFGLQFMDGSRKKSRGSVEDMKAKSAEAAAAERAEAAEQAAEAAIAAMLQAREAQQAAEEAAAAAQADALADVEAREASLLEREQQLQARERAVQQREQESSAAIRRGRVAMAEDVQPDSDTQQQQRRLPDISGISF